MPIISAQMRLNMTTNVSADAVVNTFHFLNTNTATGAADIEVGLFSLYDDLRTLYSDSVAQNGHELKLYDLSLPIPRAPIEEVTYNFTSAPSGNTLPHAVSLVGSFQGPRVSGVPQARRRGRIYVGPLRALNVTTDGRPNATAITVLRNALESLSTFMGTTTTDWVVYSPTAGDTVEVTNGWVDDRYDIQRRRARDASTRDVWP